MRQDPALPEPIGKCQHDRRLAGAAGNEIADTYHRDRRAVRAGHSTAQSSGGIKRRADWQQQIGNEPRRLSPEDGGGAHSSP
jgi:hypothetical protein